MLKTFSSIAVFPSKQPTVKSGNHVISCFIYHGNWMHILCAKYLTLELDMNILVVPHSNVMLGDIHLGLKVDITYASHLSVVYITITGHIIYSTHYEVNEM